MITGIIGSLIATMIWVILAYIFTGKYKTLIKGFFVTALDIGVSNIFSSEQDIEYINDLNHELKKSSLIKLYFARGRFLDKEPLRTLYNMDNIVFQILLPDISNTSDPNWIEIGSDNMIALDTFIDSISASISHIKSLGKSNIELGLYNALPLGKIIITDRVAYFSPYVKGDYADKVEICKYKSNTLMYKWLVRYFDALWSARNETRELSN